MKKLPIALLSGAAAIAGAAGLLTAKKKRSREELRITAPRGIDEEEYAAIGGIEQYLYHRGRDVLNPVVLYLHGGPGSPELPFINKFQPAWEDRITVVHWDQRGCGKTFFRNDPDKVSSTLTLERLLLDLDEVVAHLKAKYHKDRIVLLGHSWGCVLGTLYAKRHPESVRAYIGVGQVVGMQENERVGYAKLVAAAEAAGNKADMERVHALSPYPGTFRNMMDKLVRVRALQIKYKLADGFTADNVKTVLASPFYSVKDSTWFLRPDLLKRQEPLYAALYDFDLTTQESEYAVPFFLIHGEEDFQTPYPLALRYFDTVSAPMKGFFPIPAAGHFTMVDQKYLFNEALFDILNKL